MTFPSGGPGYPQQGQPSQGPPPSGGFPQQPQPQQGPPSTGAGAPPNLPLLLSLGVTVLGVVEYFLGFASESGGAGQTILFLLVGGLLSAMNVLPNGPKTLPFAALFSVVGGLTALDLVISAKDVAGIVIVVLILGILQMVASVAVLLFEYGVLKPPAPQPKVPAYSQPFAPQGQYQPTQYQPAPGQSAPGQPPAGQPQPPAGQPQPPAGPPATPPGAQATTYAPQQGQFFQPPADQNKPGTPPGGFGQQG